MKTVKLGIETLAVPDIVLKARTLVARMDGNKHFSSPNPSLEVVSAAATALENAYEAAQNGGKSERILLQQCSSELTGLIKMLAGYVQSVSAGEEQVIDSSGFEVRRKRAVSAPMENPAGVRGKATNHAGEILLRWNPAVGARSYTAEVSIDGMIWKPCGVATKSRLLVTGLPEGSKPLFRVAAIGPLGQSGWSDPGAVRVD